MGIRIIGTASKNGVVSLIYLPADEPDPAEGQIINISDYDGDYRIGRTFFDEDGQRSTVVEQVVSRARRS